MSVLNYNILGKPEPLRMYLCKPDEKAICALNGIVEDTAQVKVKLNGQYELSFEYNRYIENDNGGKIESNGYKLFGSLMKIFVEDVGFFIMDYPQHDFDGEREYKTVTAYSVDSELENRKISNWKINCGTSDSLEYLVTYDDDETESLLNPYTNLPYDYIFFYDTRGSQLEALVDKYSDGTITDEDSVAEIVEICDLIPRLKSKITYDDEGYTVLNEYVIYTYDDDGVNVISVQLNNFNERVAELATFYNKYQSQLSMLDLLLDDLNGMWTVGEIDSSLVNKKYQFNIESDNIYSFLTQTLASKVECIVMFDLFRKTINIKAIENIGEDTGIMIDRENLMKTISITCDEESFYTRYIATGSDDLGLEYVNFGENVISDFTYMLYATDESGNRIYVDDNLFNKYIQYMADREIARERYIELTTSYNQNTLDISNLTYMVPNDYLSTDWSEYTYDELEDLYQEFLTLYNTLLTMYKADYGTNGCNEDGSVNVEYLATTEYWADYQAYLYIMDQVQAAAQAYVDGSTYADITDEATLEKINAWETDWTLYGTVELENKIATYENSMLILIEAGSVVVDDSTLYTIKAWDDLTDDEKAEYGNLSDNYYYDTYMELLENRNSAKEYLETLYEKIATWESAQEATQIERTAIVRLVNIKYYNRTELGEYVTLEENTELTEDYFTEDEIYTISSWYRDAEYNNSYILTTSLDDIVTTIDVERELLEDAQEQLSIAAQPQFSFTATMNDLLTMKEFESFKSKFELGNFIMLQYYDNYYVKLRLVEFTFNPCAPASGDLTVGFSNFIKSNSELNDVTSLLGNSSSSSSSSSNSSSSSGTFGDSDDIDVTLSNIMLAKLVSSETFGTAVTNVILDTMHLNALYAKSATFGGLVDGTTEINGQCITTGWIVSVDYNGEDGSIDNTEGSIINLEDGCFSFAGGRIKWDGTTLYIQGEFDFSSDDTIAGLQASITANAEAITAEYNRAVSAESTLSTSITANADGLAAEIKRATEAEGTLETNITANATAISTEVSRATEAEGTLQTSITQNAESISAEVTRATEAEGTLKSSIEANAEAITAEVTRAEGAESTLSNTIISRSSHYATCVTVEGTAAKIADCDDFELYTGAMVTVYFKYANTADSPTLNVNQTGAKTIRAYDETLTSDSTYNWTDLSYVSFIYDGTYWAMADSSSLAKIQITSDSILSTVSTNMTTLEGDITKAYTSLIEQTAESIETSISDLEGNYSTLSQTVSGLSSTVSTLDGNYSTLSQTVDGLSSTVSSLASGNVSSVVIQYAVGTSSTTAPTSGWSTSYPTITSGQYIWQRTLTTYGDGTTSNSDPVCIASFTDSDSTITNVTQQYYLSSSSTSVTGGSWSDSMPSWKSGYYIWARTKMEWSDGSITYTDAILATAINDANSTAYAASSSIEQLADSITLSVTNGSLGNTATIKISANGDEVSSETLDLTGVRTAFANDTTAITISAGTVTFSSNTFVVNSTNFSVTASGSITATAGSIGGWTITTNAIYNGCPTYSVSSTSVAAGTYIGTSGILQYASSSIYVSLINGVLTAYNAVLSGTVYATAGQIGGSSGFTITTNKMYTNNHVYYNSTVEGVYIGTDYIALGSGGVFYVTSAGKLYCSNAEIEGKITASSGKIGCFNITSSSMYTNYDAYGTYSGNIYIGSSGISLGTTFKVSSSGALTCTSGSIGGWTISSSGIYNGCTSMDSTTQGLFLGTTGIKSYYSSSRYVTIASGVLTAYGAVIKGSITTTSLLVYDTIQLYSTERDVTVDAFTAYYNSETYGVQIGTSSTMVYVPNFMAATATVSNNLVVNGSITGASISSNSTISASGAISTTSTITATGNITSSATISCNALKSTSSVTISDSTNCSGAFTNYGTLYNYFPDGDCGLAVYYSSSYGDTVRFGYSSSVPCGAVISYTDEFDIYSSNNATVNFGTTSYPTSAVNIYSSSVNFLKNSTSGATITFGSSSYPTSSVTIYSSSVTFLKNSTSSVGSITFGSGNYPVNIGAYGNTYFGNTSYSSHVFVYGGSGNTGLQVVTGKLLVGTTSVTSDARLKKNWRDISQYDGIFDALIPYGFQYIYNDLDVYHLGFKAQDVRDALLANGMTESDFGGFITNTVDKDSPVNHGYDVEYGLDYHEFIPLLVYEEQKSKKRISELESNVENLLSQLALMKTQLQQLQASA